MKFAEVILSHMRWFVAAAIVVASLVSVPSPVASAAKHPCERTMIWTSVFTQDTWVFERCRNTMKVIRSGGKLGFCTQTYPSGRLYRVPDDDCAYYVNGGPI